MEPVERNVLEKVGEVTNSWGVLWLHAGVCVLFFVFSFFVRWFFISSTLTLALIYMKRINAVVSNEAHKILVDYQSENGFGTRDDALDALLHEFVRLRQG